MSTQQILVNLATGAELVASRVMPFPHRYTLVHGGRFLAEFEEWVIGTLVERKLIVPRPLDALWDRIGYPLTVAGTAKAHEYYAHGFARCPRCLAVAGLSSSGKLARHGFVKGEKDSACKQSGFRADEDPDAANEGQSHAA